MIDIKELRKVTADCYWPTSPVTIGGWRYTMEERKPGRIMARLTGMCGKEGRFWEAKL